MSGTIRKDKNDKKYKESIKKKEGHYRCHCDYCSGVSKNKLVHKIAKKEMKEDIKTVQEIELETNTLLTKQSVYNHIRLLVNTVSDDLELGEAVRKLFS